MVGVDMATDVIFTIQQVAPLWQQDNLIFAQNLNTDKFQEKGSKDASQPRK